MALSLVIPARNAAGSLPACLEAIQREAGDVEVIVVDDGSTDNTGAIARSYGATVVRHDVSAGPAAARNTGVRHAAGDVLLFVDSDVVLTQDAISRVRETLGADPQLSAVFGSYDDRSLGRGFVSDYRNLMHHFIHQSSSEHSSSFWTGCGAIRKYAFIEAGGFDERCRRPSIEDIRLGSELARRGHRVRLDKHLQCTHLKRWTIRKAVLTDVRDRAYPWSQLILEQGTMPMDLNLQHAHRASAALVWVSLLLAVALFVDAIPVDRAVLVSGIVLAFAGILALNRDFYSFLVRRRGVVFLLRALVLHGLYYVYASATYAWCWGAYQLRRVSTREQQASRAS